MTYRGIYRDGIVRLEGEVDLQDGSIVDVSPAIDPRLPRTPAERRRAIADGKAAAALWKRLSKKKMTKRERLAAAEAAYGSWKNRPEWEGKSSVEIAAELRRRATRRVRNG